MTPEETAWVAGIVEGEGCFDANQNGKPRLRVQMKDEDVIQRLRKLTGVGTIRLDDANSRRNPKRSKTWVWGVYKEDDVRSLTILLAPWLGRRRQEKLRQLQ